MSNENTEQPKISVIETDGVVLDTSMLVSDGGFNISSLEDKIQDSISKAFPRRYEDPLYVNDLPLGAVDDLKEIIRNHKRDHMLIDQHESLISSLMGQTFSTDKVKAAMDGFGRVDKILRIIKSYSSDYYNRDDSASPIFDTNSIYAEVNNEDIISRKVTYSEESPANVAVEMTRRSYERVVLPAYSRGEVFIRRTSNYVQILFVDYCGVSSEELLEDVGTVRPLVTIEYNINLTPGGLPSFYCAFNHPGQINEDFVHIVGRYLESAPDFVVDVFTRAEFVYRSHHIDPKWVTYPVRDGYPRLVPVVTNAVVHNAIMAMSEHILAPYIRGGECNWETDAECGIWSLHYNKWFSADKDGDEPICPRVKIISPADTTGVTILVHSGNPHTADQLMAYVKNVLESHIWSHYVGLESDRLKTGRQFVRDIKEEMKQKRTLWNKLTGTQPEYTLQDRIIINDYINT